MTNYIGRSEGVVTPPLRVQVTHLGFCRHPETMLEHRRYLISQRIVNARPPPMCAFGHPVTSITQWRGVRRAHLAPFALAYRPRNPQSESQVDRLGGKHFRIPRHIHWYSDNPARTMTCHTGLLAATRGDLWEDGPERWRLNPHTPMTCQARTKILYCIVHRVKVYQTRTAALINAAAS